MFISDEEIRDVHKLDKKDKELAKAFIKGAVYSWLNSHGETVLPLGIYLAKIIPIGLARH